MIDSCRFFRHCRARIATFFADDSGAVLPLVTVSMVAFIGLTTLAIDLSRLMDLQTQMQKAADAFALAGAAALDGDPDAITHADAAIDTLMASKNSSIWGGTVTVSSRTYYSALPATDDLAMSSGTVAANGSVARYVEVVVTPVTINTFLPATLFGAVDNTLTTSASAVAGLTQALCKRAPVFICNPYEGTGDSNQIYEESNIGKMFKLKSGPKNGDSYAPGNFGFLSVDGNGAKVLKDALAANDSGACFRQDGVTTEPGNIASASDALNVRFDVYDGSAKSYKDANHSPAPNVRKGCLPKSCDGCIKSYKDLDTYCQKATRRHKRTRPETSCARMRPWLAACQPILAERTSPTAWATETSRQSSTPIGKSIITPRHRHLRHDTMLTRRK